MPIEVKSIETPDGPARLHVNRAVSPGLTLMLSHGSGPGGIDSAGFPILAKALPRQGVTVIRVEHPWKVAGQANPSTRSASLDTTLRLALDSFRLRTPLVLGGRGFGARSASRMSRELGAAGVLGLAFPLHLRNRPDRSYAAELLRVRVPMLLIQGDRDLHGTPDEFPPGVEICVVPGADHEFDLLRRGPLRPGDVDDIIVEATLEWLVREVTGNRIG